MATAHPHQLNRLLIVEGDQVCQAQFAPHESMLAFPNMCFIWLVIAPWEFASLPSWRLKHDWWVCSFLDPFLSLCWGDRVIFAFFQSSGTYPSLHKYSKIMESGLTTTSASFLNTLAWILFGPINLQGSGSFNSSYTNSSFTDVRSVCASTRIFAPRAWSSTVVVKTELEEVLRISAFSVLLSRFPLRA